MRLSTLGYRPVGEAGCHLIVTFLMRSSGRGRCRIRASPRPDPVASGRRSGVAVRSGGSFHVMEGAPGDEELRRYASALSEHSGLEAGGDLRRRGSAAAGRAVARPGRRLRDTAAPRRRRRGRRRHPRRVATADAAGGHGGGGARRQARGGAGARRVVVRRPLGFAGAADPSRRRVRGRGMGDHRGAR